jgi:hypothetical protein
MITQVRRVPNGDRVDRVSRYKSKHDGIYAYARKHGKGKEKGPSVVAVRYVRNSSPNALTVFHLSETEKKFELTNTET